LERLDDRPQSSVAAGDDDDLGPGLDRSARSPESPRSVGYQRVGAHDRRRRSASTASLR
jgi:hypothetical protein